MPHEPPDVFPIWAKEHRTNPHPLYARMRSEAPVYRAISPQSGQPVWFFTRYDDCVAVLKDPRFGKEINRQLNPEQAEKHHDADDDSAIITRNMLNLDPPDHTRLRGLVHKAFTPQAVENLRARAEEIAATLLDEMKRSGGGDLITSYAFPLPITVIAELLGIPADNQERLRTWTHALLLGGNPEDLQAAVHDFRTYMHALFDERRAHPRDDLISAMLTIEASSDQLSRTELMSMVFLLLVAAGSETTVNLIANGAFALLQHPDQMRKLRESPDLINDAVEEMLRYESPLERATLRWAFEDVEIDGQMIRKGEIAMPVLLAANRDPAHFHDPDRFDITRSPNRHIAFGSGIHHCLGAPLARLQGAVAINSLLQRLPELRLNASVEALEWHQNLLIRGLKTLPVTC